MTNAQYSVGRWEAEHTVQNTQIAENHRTEILQPADVEMLRRCRGCRVQRGLAGFVVQVVRWPPYKAFDCMFYCMTVCV